MSKSYPVNERGEIGSGMNGKEQKVNSKEPAGFGAIDSRSSNITLGGRRMNSIYL